MTSTTIDNFTVVGEPIWVRYGWDRRINLNAGSRAVLAAAATWMPLLLGVLWYPGAHALFTADLQLHARFLVALPTLIAVEPLIAERLAVAARQLVASGIVPADQLQALLSLEARILRGRDARLAPWLLAAIAVSISFLPGAYHPSYLNGGFPWLWYGLVSAPGLRFVLLRWLWWIALWGYFLFRVSRLRLCIPAIHPDRRGGMAFLSECLTSFSWITFAIAVPVVAAAYHQHNVVLVPEGLPSYFVPLAMVAATIVLITFGPLLAFAPQLRVAMRSEDHRFSAVAARQANDLDRKWLRGQTDLSLLSPPDFSTVQDLQETFTRTSNGVWVPITLHAMLIVASGAFAAAIPFLLADHALLSVGLKILHALG